MAGLRYKGLRKSDQGQHCYTMTRQERILHPSKCTKRCKTQKEGRQCMNLREGDRKAIFSAFWYSMDWSEKKVYVLGLVEKNKIARRTVDTASRRQFSYNYFLRVGGQRIPVCKDMFLSTLGLNEKMVYGWIDSSRLGFPGQSKPSNLSGDDADNKDGANCAEKANKDSEIEARAMSRVSIGKECAKEFLNKLPKVPSHYCRASTSKLYIEPLFHSLKELHDEYIRQMQVESKPVLRMTTFTKVFKEMNLSLFRPKKDLCDTCCGHDAGIVDDCEYAVHIRKKEEARASKQTDKERAESNGNLKVLTVDLQSLLLCPKLNASCLYYKTKLSCHNYTLYDLTSKEVTCYFWHEVGGELNSSVFASCLLDYLEQIVVEGIDNIIIYSDGCGYQNRNVILSNALTQFAMKRKVTVEQKYLERGHTQMECDSIHSVIERKIRNRNIYIPQHYVDNIESARKDKPYRVKYLDHTFFKDYTSVGKYRSIRPGIGVGSATVNEIRLLKYTEDGTIHYKTDYGTTEYQPLPEPRNASSSNDQEPKALYRAPLPLKQSKFVHLQQLKEVIPRDYHNYYDNLPHQ